MKLILKHWHQTPQESQVAPCAWDPRNGIIQGDGCLLSATTQSLGRTHNSVVEKVATHHRQRTLNPTETKGFTR
jgi:hypothetical protein